MHDLTNSNLGQYRIIEQVGRGGMATVYKAFQPSLERHVAIKVLLQTEDPQFVARFKREARAIAQLQHSNILPIYDFGEHDGLLYLVLQYVENGATLGDSLGQPMDVVRALRIAQHVLSALDYAHVRGIIHRDIKPGNILMPSPNWPMLADFGIASLLSDNQHLTMPGMIMGTAAYMAPEQAIGRPADARTDLYAVGVVLYQMVTGQVPFDGDTPMAMLTKHVYEPPPPARSLNPDLPASVEAVLDQALTKDPSTRYQSAAEMATALERLAGQLEQARIRTQITTLYQTGVRAFEEGQWTQAIAQLLQVTAIDPSFEDAQDLIATAKAAQQRAQEEARQTLEQVRVRRQNTLYGQAAVAPSQPAPEGGSPAAGSAPGAAAPRTIAPGSMQGPVPPAAGASAFSTMAPGAMEGPGQPSIPAEGATRLAPSTPSNLPAEGATQFASPGSPATPGGGLTQFVPSNSPSTPGGGVTQFASSTLPSAPGGGMTQVAPSNASGGLPGGMTEFVPSTSGVAQPAHAQPQGRGRRWGILSGLAALGALAILLGLTRFLGVWPDQNTQAAGRDPASQIGIEVPKPAATVAEVATDQLPDTTAAAPVEATPAPDTTSSGDATVAPLPATTAEATSLALETPAPAPEATAAVVDPVEVAPEGMPPPLGALVFEDDFSARTTKTGLQDLPTAPDFQRGVHDPGVYHFKVLGTNETRWTTIPRFAYGNFSMQMEMWDNSDSFEGSVVQGAIFRVRGPEQFYAVLLNPRTGQYSIRKLDGKDNWSDLIPWTSSLLVKQQAEHNVLRVDAEGENFTVYLNDMLLDRFTDSAFSFGMYGFIVTNVDAFEPHMHFDNIKVWSSDTGQAVAQSSDPPPDMVAIPGGEFVMGSNEGNSQPPHIVALEDFLIDRTEVTNAMYQECVAAATCTPPNAIGSVSHPSYFSQAEFANYPVIHVSWGQAREYCGSVGKRLPSEAEWEKAASWNAATQEKFIYPWSSVFDPQRLNSREASILDTSAVDEFPAELNATLGMGGNVREWTNTLLQPYPYVADDGREDIETPGDRVFRGGSWAQTYGKAKTFVREAGSPTFPGGTEIGFRCAVTVEN